ncbi:hypothetical protein GOODEAATRI_029314 [Goodea atripinnis]|uniref:Uncharacterized protein n=1 Tax=Goodea atripinnis TaxID=208336 RepID=A0ABV0NEN1_9TELE
MNSTPEKLMKTYPNIASSTQPRPSTLPHPALHHTAHSDRKARAPHNPGHDSHWRQGGFQSHRKKYQRKATTACQSSGTLPTPHLNPGGPSMPAAHTPTRHTLLHQAGRLAIPSSCSK